ncbi:MAG: small multi-drug export protein, partial [Candidatus Omnitrophica bacterium]|nr:small multi-drug export protein [Candidatus Omnitrophota bacterium]
VGIFFSWWFRRVEKRSDVVKKWGFWGLVLLVAIPLPVTGAWTGTVAANLFELKIKKSFFAILIGVLIAGLIVSLVVKGVIGLEVFIKSF